MAAGSPRPGNRGLHRPHAHHSTGGQARLLVDVTRPSAGWRWEQAARTVRPRRVTRRPASRRAPTSPPRRTGCTADARGAGHPRSQLCCFDQDGLGAYVEALLAGNPSSGDNRPPLGDPQRQAGNRLPAAGAAGPCPQPPGHLRTVDLPDRPKPGSQVTDPGERVIQRLILHLLDDRRHASSRPCGADPRAGSVARQTVLWTGRCPRCGDAEPAVCTRLWTAL